MNRALLRRGLLGAGLVLSAWLALMGDKTPDPVTALSSDPSARGSRTLSPTRKPAPADWAGIRLMPRTQLVPLVEVNAAAVDVFADSPPPPPLEPRHPKPSPVAPPPPVPVAADMAVPSLPFVFIGKQKPEDGAWEVFLLRQDQVLVTRAGDALDRVYRVDRIAPPLMHLTYLPRQAAQTLAIGDSN